MDVLFSSLTCFRFTTGVKDASDKKILVDMLFWAVDNPAPANYLLISGDRDFSNALHQLRMRRYNILLAQPQKASAPLIAAAKSVWLWTSLSAGGSPLTTGESSQLTNGNHTFNSEISQHPGSELLQANQQMGYHESLSLGNQKPSTFGKVGDPKSKGKCIKKTSHQPVISRAFSVPAMTQESKNNDYPYQPEHTQAKQFKKAPHEYFGGSEPVVSVSRSTTSNFFPGNLDPSGSNGYNVPGNQQSHYPPPLRPNNLHVQPPFGPDNLRPPNFHNHGFRSFPSRPDGPRFSSAPLTNVPDIGKLGISEYSNYVQNAQNFHYRNGEEIKPRSAESANPANLNISQKGHNFNGGQAFHHDAINNRYPRGSEHVPLPSAPIIANNVSTNGIWGSKGCAPPPDVQGLIGVILLALNTLKVEKIMPTEVNITDCIRYGDPNHRNTDVRKALDCAIEQHMVVKQNLGAVQLYVGKNEKLWKCVNLIGGNLNQYPKATWDRLQKFLASSAGRSALLASQCR